MARTVTWLNDDNKTCVLTLVDDNSSTVALTPAAEPFTTSIQESDDLFTPIRSSNGYIRVVVNSVESIADLVGAAPIDRAVYLSVNSNARWKGFLACETFTQAWDRGPIEVELPVVSPLEVAKGIYPSSALANLGYINFAQFLYNMNAALGVGFTSGVAWNRFYFPVLSYTPTTLKYQFDMKNYAVATDKNTKHETESYYTILEDICKLFGWQAVEYEHDLVFLAADVKELEFYNNRYNNYRGYNNSRMLQIATGGSTDVNDRPEFNQVTPIIFGADHDMSWLAGKKSVEVTGQLNERNETIWNMDVVSQCEYKGSDKAETLGTTSFHYFVKKYESPTGGNIQVTNSIGGVSQPSENIKFVNFKNGNENAYGGSIGYEKYYYSDDSNGHVILSGSDTWVKRLILRSSPNTASFVSHRIVTNFFYSPSQNARAGAQIDAFLITGTLLYASDRQAFFEKTSGYRYTKVAFKIEGSSTYYWSPANGWSTTYAEFLIRSKDGELAEYGYYHNGQTLFVPNIPAPTNIEGQVTMNIISANSTDVESWPGSAYIAYEDLAIKLIASENTRGALTIEDKEQRMNENQKKIDLNNGFTDSWSRDCGLTLAREDVPDSYGVVLNANKEQPENLYNSKWPEDAMAERANNYFARARRRIRAIVQSHNKLLSPMVSYLFETGGIQYIVIEQQKNWRTGEVRANFYELYEPEDNSL